MDWVFAVLLSIWLVSGGVSLYFVKRAIAHIRHDHERILEFRTAAVIDDVLKLRQRNARLESEKLYSIARLKAAEETLAAAQRNASAEVELQEEHDKPRNAKKSGKYYQ